MNNYYITYKRNGVYQALIYKAESAGKARAYFEHRKPDATFLGITEKQDISTEIRKGMPIITVG